ncbi:hypothetical protein DB88DRAFT_112611 [Papiliotrema laurentii]|uniref:FCP1 homology domain-containing protein n=1 Tax=Papiliotrema laurentii TaxID=5418 RepID=A0AAD9CUN1_PAPLA|nr:hypothetical protein DB88DRAFT_112611 [Papiliotrema laurentii]
MSRPRDASKMSYRRSERGRPEYNGDHGAPGYHTYEGRRHDYAPRRDGEGHHGPAYPHPQSFEHHHYTPPPSNPSGPYGMRRSPPQTLPPFPPSQFVQQRGYHSNSPSRGGSPGPQRSDGRYVPPHLRGSTPEPSTAPPSGPASPSFRGPRKEPAPYVPTLPPPEYLELSRPVTKLTSPSSSIIPKLLVLDLNGALIYRSGSRSTERTIYPRPYLGNFLEYLFGPQPNVPVHADFDSDSRPWEVFVWSSAQPHNVRAMVETGFGRKWTEGVFDNVNSENASAGEKGEGRLLGVWARDKMDLSSNDYNRKVQTFKDLRKVLTHLAEPDTGSSRPPRVFDEKRVFLLDDSPLKAVNQPWNQLVVPEYGIKEFQASKEAIRLDDPLAEGSGMDRALLAVIGILEELRTVGNIPAWVRGGGLMANQKDDIDSAVSRLSVDRDTEVTMEDLPSHESFQHWHTVPSIFQYWVEKGMKALESRGIEVDHGLDNAGRSKHARTAPTRADSPPGHYPTAYQNTRRAWSPSAPSSPARDGLRSPSPDRSSRAGTPKQSDSHRRYFSSEARPSADGSRPRAFDNESPSRPDLRQVANAEDTLQSAPRLHIPRGIRTDSWRPGSD